MSAHVQIQPASNFQAILNTVISPILDNKNNKYISLKKNKKPNLP